MHAATPHETSKRRPPKKVLKILDNFSSKSEGLTSTLFIGDLSVICDEIKLYELFSRFGVVETVQLKKSDRDPQRAHLGYGFIKFSTREAAEESGDGIKNLPSLIVLSLSMHLLHSVE